MKESIRRIIGVAVFSSKWIFRQPLWLFQSAIFILGILIMLFAWGGLNAIKNLALAFIIVGFWNSGLNLIAQEIGWSKITKVNEMYYASPVKIYEYYLGVTIGTLIFSVMDIISAAILLYIVKMLYILPILIPLGVIALVLGSFLGLIIVLRIKNPTNISAITNPLSTLTTILPPVYYPAIILPKQIAYFLTLFPTATLMEIARNIIGVKTILTINQAVIITLTWLVIVIILLTKTIKWGLE